MKGRTSIHGLRPCIVRSARLGPEVRGMNERAFFLLMEKVFSLPEVAALVSHATDQQEGG